jgi:serine/threonine-protein kinase
MLDPPLEPGTTIGDRYVVERLIGKGGMGIVVKARHEELGQTFAIKVLREGILESGEAQARFLREARALARFQSEHVVRVTDIGRLTSGTPYMVMEYLEGTDLASLTARGASLPMEEAVDYVVQAAAGLAEAHAQGLVHRDLKPGNLFLTRRVDGSPLVKVIDFGIAKSLLSKTVVTQGERVLGSPRYMAPEQLKASRNTDTRADVWALGAILFRLLTGHTPFEQRDMLDLIRAITKEPAPLLRSLRPDLPEDLEAVVARCLVANPEQRIPSVGELARDLADFGTEHTKLLAPRILRVSNRPPPPAPESMRGAPSEDVDRESATREEAVPASNRPPDSLQPSESSPSYSLAGDAPEPTLTDPGAIPPKSTRRVAATQPMTVPLGPAVPLDPRPASMPPPDEPAPRRTPWLVAVGIVVVTLAVVVIAMVATGAVPAP